MPPLAIYITSIHAVSFAVESLGNLSFLTIALLHPLVSFPIAYLLESIKGLCRGKKSENSDVNVDSDNNSTNGNEISDNNDDTLKDNTNENNHNTISNVGIDNKIVRFFERWLVNMFTFTMTLYLAFTTGTQYFLFNQWTTRRNNFMSNRYDNKTLIPRNDYSGHYNICENAIDDENKTNIIEEVEKYLKGEEMLLGSFIFFIGYHLIESFIAAYWENFSHSKSVFTFLLGRELAKTKTKSEDEECLNEKEATLSKHEDESKSDQNSGKEINEEDEAQSSSCHGDDINDIGLSDIGKAVSDENEPEDESDCKNQYAGNEVEKSNSSLVEDNKQGNEVDNAQVENTQEEEKAAPESDPLLEHEKEEPKTNCAKNDSHEHETQKNIISQTHESSIFPTLDSNDPSDTLKRILINGLAITFVIMIYCSSLFFDKMIEDDAKTKKNFESKLTIYLCTLTKV